MNAESTVTSYRGQMFVQGQSIERGVWFAWRIRIDFTERIIMEFKFSAKMRNWWNCILSDIFVLLNQLNISLQEHNSFIIDLYEKLNIFKWRGIMIVKGEMMDTLFRKLTALFEESVNGTCLNKSLISEIKLYLLCWKGKISWYFPDTSNKLFALVKSPFTLGFDEIGEIAQE
jgi:hypothetical protein